MLRRLGFRLSLVAALGIAVLLALAPASAQTLNQLRQSGVVGERFDGLAVLREGGASSNARAVVKQVNKKRRQLYGKRAKQQNAPIDQVGRVFAKKILGKAPKGTWFLEESGRWRRK